MVTSRFYHLDCSPVIPECGYKCAACIREILTVFGSRVGVCDVSSDERGGISGIVVKYDTEKISDDEILYEFRTLPSFYKGRFSPKALDP